MRLEILNRKQWSNMRKTLGPKGGIFAIWVLWRKTPKAIIVAISVQITRNQAHWMRLEILNRKQWSNMRKTLFTRKKRTKRWNFCHMGPLEKNSKGHNCCNICPNYTKPGSLDAA